MADGRNRPNNDNEEIVELERDLAVGAAAEAQVERDAAEAAARDQIREKELAQRVAAQRAYERDQAVMAANAEAAVANQSTFGMWLLIGVISALAFIALVWGMLARPWEDDRTVLHTPPATTVVVPEADNDAPPVVATPAPAAPDTTNVVVPPTPRTTAPPVVTTPPPTAGTEININPDPAAPAPRQGAADTDVLEPPAVPDGTETPAFMEPDAQTPVTDPAPR